MGRQFGFNSGDITFLEALKEGGGDLRALHRASAAACLNAKSDDVSYYISCAEVVTLFNDAVDDNTEGATAHVLDDANNRGCPIDQQGDSKYLRW